MQNSNPLVLEITKQPDTLKMSLFEQKELTSTLRHYSQCAVSFKEINKLCEEVVSILNKADKKGSSLGQDLIQPLSKAGQFLFDHLFTASVKDRLKHTQITDLILSIDEELISIPWELFYDGKNFLCLRFNLGRVVRTKKEANLAQYRSFSSILSMLILANPTNDLKSAYLEGVNIRNQFDRKRNSMRIDFKSTYIEKLYLKKNLCDYDIVHFAGHAEYESAHPENSGWILSDGRFTTQDISTLSSRVSLPSLVFSNACHSAVTDLLSQDYQEENYNLAQAFLFSGVRHYIGTIRKIEDPVSLVFAKEFYTELISGKSVGESLRLSRGKLIKEHGINSIHWASYLLYGDPNFVLFRTEVRQPKLKVKKNIFQYKKQLAGIALAVAIISISIYLLYWLPTINPNTYLLFAKSKKLFLKGNNQEVISLCSQLIKKDPAFLATYSLLADTYQRLGDRGNALKYYYAYITTAEKRKNKQQLASAYTGIGWSYHLQGEYTRAFDFYNQAITLSRENKDRLNEARAMERLAVWYIDKEDYDKALELLMKSSSINRERQNIREHRYGLACDYFDIGLVFINKDDFVTAREFYNKSKLLFENLKLKHELSDCYFNLGEISLYEKEYQKALDYYQKGLDIDQRLGHLPNIASDYNMLGELYLEMDNLVEAERYFEQAISVSKQINALPELGSAYYNLGRLYKQKGQKNKAREYLRLAQELYSHIDAPNYQNTKKELLELDNPDRK